MAINSIWFQRLLDSKYIVLVLIINILVRFPFEFYIKGNDDFIVAWMALSISKGWYGAWLISPLSIFGLYPFSFYPIGTPFFLSIFLSSGLSLDLSVFLFSISLSIFAVFNANKLSEFLFPNEKFLQFWFTLFYTTSILFLGYSNFNSSARGAFLAFLPLALRYTFELLLRYNKNVLFKFLLSVFLLALTHPLIVVFFVMVSTILISILFSKVKFEIKVKNTTKFVSVLFGYFISLCIGILLLGAGGFFQLSFQAQNLGYELSYKTFFYILTQFIIEFGILCLLFPIGIYLSFKAENNNSINFSFINIGFFLFFIVPRIDYSFLFVLPWICYYSVIFLKSMIKLENSILEYFFSLVYLTYLSFYLILKTIGFSNIFSLLYYLIFLIFLFLIISFLKMKKIFKLNNFHYLATLLLIIIFLNIFTTSNSNIKNNLTIESREIAGFLKKINLQNYITIAYSVGVAREISAYSFMPVIPSINPPASLFYNYNSLNKDKIIDNTHFDIINTIKYGTPFYVDLSFLDLDYYYMFLNFVNFNLTIQKNLDELNLLGIKYLIMPNINKLNDIYYLTEGPANNLNLFKTILQVGTLLANTSNLFLYEIPRLVS